MLVEPDVAVFVFNDEVLNVLEEVLEIEVEDDEDVVDSDIVLEKTDLRSAWIAPVVGWSGNKK